MSCENCKKEFSIDGTEPDCWEGECRVPGPGERGQWILEMRSLIIKLHDLVDPGSILGMYGADLEDIKLLAEAEEEIRRLNPTKDP